MAYKAKTAAFSEDDGEGVVEFNDMTAEFGEGNAPRWILRTIADLFDRLRDRTIERDGLEAADLIVPRWQIDSIRDAGLMTDTESGAVPAYADGEEADITDPNEPSQEELQAMNQKAEELAARETELNSQKDALDARQREFDERTKVEARGAATHFADQLVNAGKLLPGKRDGVVELLITADAAAPLSFGEGDDATEQAAGELLRELLNGQPQQIDFNERSAEGDAPAAVDFSAPAGSAIDADRLAIHTKATAHQRVNPGTSYVDAVKAVGG